MGAPRHATYKKGEASNYVTRKQAMKKLQLNLKDFRRICILKGIHPREPRNRKRAQKGDLSKVQTLYHEKDIRFLLHEPIVWKFRDFKVFLRKVKRAKDKGEWETVQRLKENKPKYNLDHVVKERYPTFIDAIRDLEDCLCLVALYSTFPNKSAKVSFEMVTECRKLFIQFMHYVIHSKSLRKVFISIKGYYFQAEILGQTLTWVIPHTFVYENPADVDVRLMSLFVEFYTTLLGFVNFRLFHSSNLKYPPATSLYGSKKEGEEADRVSSLTCNLLTHNPNNTTSSMHDNEDETNMIDDISCNEESKVDDPSQAEEKGQEIRTRELELKKFTNLFSDVKFFLQREVPQEQFIFIIRCFGGSIVSDYAHIDDQSITHQICDRPQVDMKHRANRVYIQPQWVVDCINKRELLPTPPYFVGETLPPHLSPFETDDRVGRYVPVLEEADLAEKEAAELRRSETQELNDSMTEGDGSGSDGDGSSSDEDEINKKQMSVTKPKCLGGEKEGVASIEAEEYRLRTMMIKKKHRGLYKSMMESRRRRVANSKQLEWKREKIRERGTAEKVA